MKEPALHREIFDVDEFARRMKDYRLDREWTLEQMANATGLDKRTIWNIENARTIPTELTVHKIRKRIRDLEAESVR